MRKKRLIGILGGMGPSATLHLFELIIKYSGAKRDQEHIPLLILNNPEIPDRTDAILHRKESPLPYLIEGAEILMKSGVFAIAIPCITAHYFIDEIRRKVKIKIIDRMEESIKEFKKLKPDEKTIGVLATDGTIKTGLLEKYFKAYDIKSVYPDDEFQRKVMETIYRIKAGFEYGGEFESAIYNLRKKGVKTVFSGCTEVAMVLSGSEIINPLEITAKRIIELSKDE